MQFRTKSGQKRQQFYADAAEKNKKKKKSSCKRPELEE